MSERWPGLFTVSRLHLVREENARRLRFGEGNIFGLADCGAVCRPPMSTSDQQFSLCAKCFSVTEGAQSTSGTTGACSADSGML